VSEASPRPSAWTIGAVVAPVLAGTLGVAVFVGFELAGGTPLAYERPANIAEAAGMGMSAEVLRFLRQGQRPSDIHHVRPEIISSSITRVTTLEASIWSRRTRLVQILDREGAIASQDDRDHLTCLARHLRADDVLTYLVASGGRGDCDADETIREIEARSR
jgi:hypothetical protein